MSEIVAVKTLGEKIREVQDRVKSFIAKRVPWTEVEDIFQEVVFNLIRTEKMLGPIILPEAWLFRAAKNEIIDFYRKRGHFLLLDFDDLEHSEIDEITEIMLEKPSDGSQTWLKNLFWEELESALQELPEPQREVFEKTELEGKSYKELSQELGVNVNTLISRKHKAILKLRESLIELYKIITKN
ncbi:MAG: RNA polymerase sigma factor [Deltaproteobacteria bacterium]|nr:RNA polymerase sigma factor [Deltaproteobacteria bacterium]